MTRQTEAELLTSVEEFISAGAATQSGLGRAALGDPNFVSELRAGRAVRAKTAARVRSYMQAARAQ